MINLDAHVLIYALTGKVDDRERSLLAWLTDRAVCLIPSKCEVWGDTEGKEAVGTSYEPRRDDGVNVPPDVAQADAAQRNQ